MPACRLTPVASYMTIRLNPRHTGNSESATPWQSATDAVSAVHRAECDEGMPPELNSIKRSHLLSKKKLMSTFIDCASDHATRPDMKVGFPASVHRKGLT